MTRPADAPRPVVVLDTNVLLDWHVFRDPIAAPLAQAVESGALDWIACDRMADEWADVWPRPVFARWQPEPERVGAAFARARMVAPPPRCAWRCKDPDDQVFIDLAVAHRATWLLTKDRALLQLARRADTAGVRVSTLQGWLDATGTSAAVSTARVATPPA